MVKKKKSLSGEELFEDFYSKVYGERWPSLKEALLKEKDHIVLINPVHRNRAEHLQPFHGKPNLFHLPPEGLQINNQTPRDFYFLDGASAFAPLALEIEPGDDVLDLCAAPGGKSLIMAYLLKDSGNLTANDKSQDRRFRMLQNLRDYLPEEMMEERVRVTGFDAGSWCLHETEAYNKILLDAPCSSERHVLESPQHLNDWRMGRTKRLSALQWTMLASAWLVLKPQGRLVYSTCSLSPLENDGVVAKLKKKFKEKVIEVPLDIPGAERTDHGAILLPDRSGYGPFYLAAFQKKP